MQAISYKYKHSVVLNQCPLCHINTEQKDNVVSRIKMRNLEREWLIYFDKVEEKMNYEAEIYLTDRKGKKCKPRTLEIVQDEIWEHEEERPSLKLNKLSGIMIEEVKKRAYVRARISWETNTFATSEIEYKISNSKKVRTYKSKDQYTKNHEIVLDGLKHKRTYSLWIISRDIYGNTQKSTEYTIDTAKEFSRVSRLHEESEIPPIIAELQVFKISDDQGFFLKIMANKSSALSLKIKELKAKDEKHGFGLLSPRLSMIEACFKCHPHDSSHPVGVKASSPKIKTPDGLPTVEDGIITCVTCHTPHGGNRQFYNRFDFRKDLCMRCHLERYGN